tara:strand:- start:1558 stop:1869 length:312 start_codon:yes stop_codon:yes gene_type:complete
MFKNIGTKSKKKIHKLKRKTKKSKKNKTGRQFDYKKKGILSYEGKNARKDLKNIYLKSYLLEKKLRNDDDLPEWVQKKISLADNYMESVYKYMNFKIKEHHYG